MNGHQRQREESARMIEEALIILMKEKEFSNISISEIAMRADVARRTFYRLYRKKEDVLYQYLERLGQEYRKRCTAINKYDFSRIALEYFTFWYSYKSILLLFHQRGMDKFLYDALGNISRDVIQRRMNGRKEEKKEYFVDYTAGGFLMLLRRWVEEGMEEVPEVYAPKVYFSLQKFIRPVQEEKKNF